MIYNYPYSYFRQYRPSSYSRTINNSNLANSYFPKQPNSVPSIKPTYSSNNDTIEDEKRVSRNEDEFFEIFGLKLYFDDILIICLLFFLYQEGVKDYYLFIALILLLLS